jgi:hypothetical protein
MNEWDELKIRNQNNMTKVLSGLNPQEQVIFQQVIDFELENRHIHDGGALRYKVPMKKIVEQNIRQDQGE